MHHGSDSSQHRWQESTWATGSNDDSNHVGLARDLWRTLCVCVCVCVCVFVCAYCAMTTSVCLRRRGQMLSGMQALHPASPHDLRARKL